ncbi:hypothetical protein MSAN_01372800 [Mycena sanguinolenta]|uniref:Uncharacterized protein n=1 Tax=Mycena sanguinolenta TaxID=230812 RepID=A0A8H7CY55_9AGAR|nr:hypothetical protein MSAN_01372800 [Mycena sanguinolenta]
MGARPNHILSNNWSVKHPFLDYSLWMGTTLEGCQYVGWFRSNLSSVPSAVLRTRQWSIDAGLYKVPTTGVPKDMETACREAAAMLGQASLASAQTFTALVAPNKSDSPSGHEIAAPLDVPSPAKVQKKSKVPKFSAPPGSPPRTERRVTPPTVPQHPCFTNPSPVSRVQPDIRAKRRGFHVRDLPPSYPYHINRENTSYRIPFLEFSGLGPPPDDLDVGTEGDVYLDLTPGVYALYGKIASGWKRWVDTGEPVGTSWLNSDWVVKHPHLEGFGLWISLGGEGDGPPGRCHVGWFRVGAVKAQRRIADKLGLVRMQKLKVKRGLPMKSEHAMQCEAHTILEYMLGDKDSIPSKLSAKRTGSPLMLDAAKKRKEDSSAPLDLGPFSMCFD